MGPLEELNGGPKRSEDSSQIMYMVARPAEAGSTIQLALQLRIPKTFKPMDISMMQVYMRLLF